MKKKKKMMLLLLLKQLVIQNFKERILKDQKLYVKIMIKFNKMKCFVSEKKF